MEQGALPDRPEASNSHSFSQKIFKPLSLDSSRSRALVGYIPRGRIVGRQPFGSSDLSLRLVLRTIWRINDAYVDH